MSNWKTVKLGNYIQEYSERNKCNAEIPVYSVTNSNGFCTEYFSKEVASKNKTTYKIVKNGYFAYNPSRINVGSVDWLREEETVIVSPLYNVFSVKGDLYQQYLYYYLKSPVGLYYIKELATGSVRDNLKLSTLAEFSISLPPLEIQHQIASTLDKVTYTINICNSILEKMDLLVKARFVEMFWEIDLVPQKTEWMPISAIGTVVGGSTPKTSVDNYWDGNLKWITPAELLSDTGYLYDSVRKITKEGAESCSLQILPKNTVILTSRAPIGKVAILGTEMYCNQGFKNIICNDTVLPRYLYSLLLYNTDYLNSLGRGATFKEISKSIVEKIRIPVPSIELQEQFAAFVEQTEKSKSAVKKILEKTETLKKSLMQKYFR